MEIDIDHLRQWIGRQHVAEDVITPRLAHGLLAILDQDGPLDPGAPAPLGIHWCLTPDIAPMSALGPDGHPARGGFLPPVPLPRRMWAGGELTFHRPFLIGATVSRHSTIRDVALKTGRSGSLCFVAVDHEWRDAQGVLLTERHDIVYRAITPSVAPPPQPARPAEQRLEVMADPVLLARYSAITFNGHRIHYDLPYCREVELYPDLVVHGPLQATWLLHLARQLLGQPPGHFVFRGVAPLFAGQRVGIQGQVMAEAAELWVTAANGAPTQQATARR